MPQIRPISDLRNNFAEISRIVHEEGEPVYLTKNGYGDIVVMSIEQYEKLQYERQIGAVLLNRGARQEVAESTAPYDVNEVSSLRQKPLGSTRKVPLALGSMSEEEFNAEIEKGFADIAAGRMRKIEDVAADFKKDYKL
jgi:prevent-host-death family protein